MSEMGEQDQVASQDPLNYAPRWLREKPEQRPAPSSELRAEREPKLESVGRAVQRTSTLDRQLESAVYESLRHSLDPEVMPGTQAVFQLCKPGRRCDRRVGDRGTVLRDHDASIAATRRRFLAGNDAGESDRGGRSAEPGG